MTPISKHHKSKQFNLISINLRLILINQRLILKNYNNIKNINNTQIYFVVHKYIFAKLTIVTEINLKEL